MICWLALATLSCCAAAQTQFDFNQSFKALYTAELGTTQKCMDSTPNRYAVCSEVLRSDGNAPFVLFHDADSPIVVLTHGLSDSPFFVTAIASELFDSGYTVVAPLLPGHGLRNAAADMADEQLAERWQAHLDDVVALALEYTDKVTLGGFSTGGALSVDYYLQHPDHVNGLLLFSGALALNSNVEALSRIWGIKSLAKLLDGDYQTAGPNPHKYPNVASFAGLELMDLIRGIRQRLDEGQRITVPVFISHSQVDQTTPIEGVIDLLDYVDADNTFYVIDAEHQLCHADLVVNRLLLEKMNFDKRRADLSETCAVPQVNPQFFPMARALRGFVEFAL
ncbi:MAG: alpha/beta fold hydrolase [Alteromonadaceae bacterium]|nr:alpha/beta fold hydrolase [Alteromonadaceae bacterium]